MSRRSASRSARLGLTAADVLAALTALTVLFTLAILATGCAANGNSRINCSNNLKQLALGLMNYQDTFLSLPYGSRNRTAGDPKEFSWGSSWFAATLPYCEQTPLYDKLNETNREAPENDYQSAAMFKVADGRELPYLLCPASPLPKSQTVSGAKIMVPSYAGIMGAAADKSEARFADGPFGGVVRGSGMLIINEALSVSACTDGTAHTLVVGEVSNWYYDDQAKKRNPALSIADAGDGAKPGAGWFAGNNLEKEVFGVKGTTIAEGSSLNLVSIEHPVNISNRQGKKDQDPSWGTEGIGRCGFNNPLSSAHGAGAMVVFLDGHVLLLPSKTALDICQKLACRDDGHPLPAEFR